MLSEGAAAACACGPEESSVVHRSALFGSPRWGHAAVGSWCSPETQCKRRLSYSWLFPGYQVRHYTSKIRATEALHLLQRTVKCPLGRRKQNFLAVFCFAHPVVSEELFCSVFTRNVTRNMDPVICLVECIHFTARMI